MQAVNLSAAVLSVGLVLGLGLWGYRLAVRDVTGVPVVRALDGPARGLPDDPEGTSAAHQGLAVNTIAAEGEAASPPDQVMLAPRAVDVEPADQPVVAASGAGDPSDPTPAAAASATARADGPDGTGSPLPVTSDLDGGRSVGGGLADGGLADGGVGEDGAGEDGVGEDGAGEDGQDPLTDVPASRPIPADVPGVARSIRPPARPGASPAAIASGRDAAPASAFGAVGLATGGADPEVDAAVAAALASLAPSDPAPEVDAAAISPGTRLVQLGAFGDPQTARLEWDRLAGREALAPLMSGKSRVIQAAESGGRTFYRLRVLGFADVDDARRFCTAFVAENAGCVPVQIR